MYLEYIFSAAFAYVGHDKKEVSVGQFQISPQGEEVARCVEQIVVWSYSSWESHLASLDGTLWQLDHMAALKHAHTRMHSQTWA